MTFSLHSQHIDSALGMHVIELRDQQGHQRIAQIAIAADACPACGHLTPKSDLNELDPKARIAELLEAANSADGQMLEYAEKHGLSIR